MPSLSLFSSRPSFFSLALSPSGALPVSFAPHPLALSLSPSQWHFSWKEGKFRLSLSRAHRFPHQRPPTRMSFTKRFKPPSQSVTHLKTLRGDSQTNIPRMNITRQGETFYSNMYIYISCSFESYLPRLFFNRGEEAEERVIESALWNCKCKVNREGILCILFKYYRYYFVRLIKETFLFLFFWYKLGRISNRLILHVFSFFFFQNENRSRRVSKKII